MIYHELFDSEAFRSMKCAERALLLEFCRRYVPDFNEDVFVSTRDAAKRLHVHPDTARKAFYVLESRGFIKLISGALWQARIARKWRLTFLSYRGREPTDEWRDYKNPEPKSRGKLSQSKVQIPFIEAAKIDD